jgi:pantetheine-phosphate adenylyltransferase
MKIAIYAGSFDPFTNGHLDILKQANELFDMIFIVFAENPLKKRSYNVDKMMGAVNKHLHDINMKGYSIYSSDKLISDIARVENAQYLIRGLRNPNDYNYEENIAKINKELNPDLNTIYLRANNEIISSTMVKELFKYGKDISKYVNPYVLEVIKNG